MFHKKEILNIEQGILNTEVKNKTNLYLIFDKNTTTKINSQDAQDRTDTLL